MKVFFTRFLPPLIPLIVAAIGFEFAVRFGWIPSYLIPAPSDVWRSLLDDRAELFSAASATALAACAGLLMSFIFGLSIAIVLSMSLWARRAFYPYAVFFQTVP